MVSENIELRVTLVDRRNTARELARIDTALTRTGNSAARAGRMAHVGARGFDRMTGGVRKLAGFAGRGLVAGMAAGGAAVAGLTYWVGKGAVSLQRIQRIGAQTNTVIKSTGGVANVTRSSLDNLAGSLESVTGTEAESTTEGANFLLTFTNIRNGVGKGNKVFDDTVRTLVDMTRALDNTGASTLDTRKQALQLGKALNDPIKGVTALSKVGVSFSEGQKKQIKTLVEHGKTMQAQKIILAELNKEFGGSGKAFGQTDAGRVERFKHAIGTLQETMASAFAPTLGKVANQLTSKGVPALERFGETFNTKVAPRIGSTIWLLRSLWGTLRNDGIDAATRRIERMTGTQGKLTPIVDKVRGILKDLGRIITNSVVPAFTENQGAIAGILSPLGHLDDGMRFLADHATLTKNVVIGLVTALTLAKVATIAMTVYTKAAAVVTGIHTAATALNGLALGTRLGLLWLAVSGWIASTAATIAHTVATGASTVVTLAAAAASGVWTGAQWLLNAALTANPIGVVVVAVGLLVAAFVVAYKKSDKFRAIVDKSWAMIKKGKWLLLGLLGPFGLLAGAFITAYKNSDKFRTVVDGLWHKVLVPFAKFISSTVVGGIRTLAVAWLSMAGFGVKAFRLLVTAAFKAFDGILAGAEKGLGWMPGLGGKIKDARKAFRRFGDSTIEKLKGVETGLHRARDQANQLGRTKPKVDVTIRYNYPVTGHPGALTGELALPKVDGRRALGGPVSKGRRYLVGEHRPEIFEPTESGRILPRVEPYRPPYNGDGTAEAHRQLSLAMGGGDKPAPMREALTVIAKVMIDNREIGEAVGRYERNAEARA